MVRRALRSHFSPIGSLFVIAAIAWAVFAPGELNTPDLQPCGRFSISVSEAAAVEEGDRRCLAARHTPDLICGPAFPLTLPPSSLAPTRPRPLRDPFYIVAHSRRAMSEELTSSGTEGDPARPSA